jgi:hypothetical protein
MVERLIQSRVPQVPFFGTWVLGGSDLFSKKSRMEHPAFQLSPQLVAAG